MGKAMGLSLGRGGAFAFPQGRNERRAASPCPCPIANPSSTAAGHVGGKIIALAGFVLGAALGALIVEIGPHHADWPMAVTWAVLVEGIIIGAFTLTWHPGVRSGAILYGLIILSAVAMGIQSAAIRHLKVPGIATTYITGTLTSMVAEFTAWLYRLRSSPLATDPTGQSAALDVPEARRYHGARLQALVLLGYVSAAALSAFLQTRQSRLVTLSPLIAVGLVVLNASLRHRRE